MFFFFFGGGGVYQQNYFFFVKFSPKLTNFSAVRVENWKKGVATIRPYYKPTSTKKLSPWVQDSGMASHFPNMTSISEMGNFKMALHSWILDSGTQLFLWSRFIYGLMVPNRSAAIFNFRCRKIRPNLRNYRNYCTFYIHFWFRIFCYLIRPKKLSKTASNFLKWPLVASKWLNRLIYCTLFLHFWFCIFWYPTLHSKKLSDASSNFLKRPLVSSKWSNSPKLLNSLLNIFDSASFETSIIKIKETFKIGL